MKSTKGTCGYNRVFSPIGAFSMDLEDILHNVFQEEASGDFSPRGNIGESETGYVIQLELPGLTIDQISLEVQENRLEISGDKTIEQNDAIRWSRAERKSGSFKRTIEFSKPVDLETVEARFENGVLNISVPKSAKALPRKIEISGSNA